MSGAHVSISLQEVRKINASRKKRRYLVFCFQAKILRLISCLQSALGDVR